MLSRTAEYALRAVLHLAERGDGLPVTVNDIATALGAPRNYLSKILHVLARGEILSSTRGPRGGFRLAVPPADLSLAQVVDSFDPPDDTSSCLLRAEGCDLGDPCPAHHRWKAACDGFRRFFEDTTIAELAGTRIPAVAPPSA
jgi:Rrf2 family protein